MQDLLFRNGLSLPSIIFGTGGKTLSANYTVDFFSSDTNFISMTPGGIQRHNRSRGQVVGLYWPTG
jgi:hypothetical protein